MLELAWKQQDHKPQKKKPHLRGKFILKKILEYKKLPEYVFPLYIKSM